MKVSWNGVDGAKAYVIHMGADDVPGNATVMYYTEDPVTELTVDDALVGETLSGVSKWFYIQAFDRLGEGANDVEKAQDLNENALGSEWSDTLKVDFPEEGAPEGFSAPVKPTSENTVAQIKEYLTAQGISFPSNATKDELLALVV